MQRKSSAHQRAVTEPQRAAAVQPAGRVVREVKAAPAPPSVRNGSGETTLGGHVDRGLTLAALYDLGVLERLRLEVRVRLLSDMAQSLGWLHANPRLMAAHPHLVVAPSTIVIGLDGVARVDVRAAKKQESERNPFETDYLAPEVASGDTAADLRADVFSLGVLAWEALAGQRICAADAWSTAPASNAADGPVSSDVPVALSGAREREPLRRKAGPPRPAPKQSPGRIRLPPPLTLPQGGEWAMPLAALALQAMGAEPGERLQDCRPLIEALEALASQLATTQEIAEVVQGISSVETLCVPQPTLPDADASCQPESGGLGFMDRLPCSELGLRSCAQRQVPAARRVVERAPAPKLASVAPLPIATPSDPDVSKTVKRLRAISSGSSSRAWFAAGLVWLAVLGSLAGYVASLLAVR